MRRGGRRSVARVLFAALAVAMLAAVVGSARADEPTVVEYFYGDGCPFCELQQEHMATWPATFPMVEVRRYEVWHDARNQEIFRRVAAQHGVEPRAVPMTFIAGRVWIGFDASSGRQMDALLASLTAGPAGPEPPPTEDERTLQIPLVGELTLSGRSLPVATALIALVDGFNPCSLWVLTVLLAVAVRTGSRRELLLVGGTFLTVTAAVYGLFIVGLFTAFTAIGMRTWIRVGVALIALAFAAVNLKDAFWFRRGPSLTIPERAKPGIIRRARRLVVPGGSPAVLVGSTILLALGVALVELPCTAGFPMLWTAMLADQEVSTASFASLLGLYLAIYLADEIAVFAVVVESLQAARLQEHHGQALKLVGGMLMLALALTLLVRPALMEDPVGALAVVGGALAASAVIEVIRRGRQPSRKSSRSTKV